MNQQCRIRRDSFDDPIRGGGLEQVSQRMDALINDKVHLISKGDEQGRITERHDSKLGWHFWDFNRESTE